MNIPYGQNIPHENEKKTTTKYTWKKYIKRPVIANNRLGKVSDCIDLT